MTLFCRVASIFKIIHKLAIMAQRCGMANTLAARPVN